jgi:Flp pilus assembly protein TadB
MTLSAQDKRIITLIERDLKQDDPRWSRRYARRHRRLDRPVLGRSSRGGRRLTVMAAFAAWVALVCADESRGPGVWLWIALVATVVAIALAVVHVRAHRRGRGGEFAV